MLNVVNKFSFASYELIIKAVDRLEMAFKLLQKNGGAGKCAVF